MSETYGRDTEVVIVLRRPDSFCESRHQERVKKTPYTAKIADYAMDPEERIGFDYAFQIQLLQKHFDTVTVLIFEKLIQDKAAGGAEQAFMKALGLEVTFERPPQRLNESLHPYLVDYKRLMNYQRDEKKGTVREFKVLLELQRNGAFEWSGEKMTMWAEADRMAFLTSLDESLTWVAENFPNLCNEEGRLFPAVSNLPLHVPETPIAIFEEILGKVTARGQVRSNAARGKKTRKRKQRD